MGVLHKRHDPDLIGDMSRSRRIFQLRTGSALRKKVVLSCYRNGPAPQHMEDNHAPALLSLPISLSRLELKPVRFKTLDTMS